MAQLSALALMFGERDVYHQLALWRMTGNMSLTRRIFRQHHASSGEPADVAITRFKFDLAR